MIEHKISAPPSKADMPMATMRCGYSGLGRGGTGVLKVDGKVVATQTMERTVPLVLQWDETFDIGADTGTPVDDHDYQVPFAFTGKIDKLTIALDPPKLSPDDVQKLEAAYRAAQDAK